MTDPNVHRKESKRWVAPKTSYDGDEWGNDEYEAYEGQPEYEEGYGNEHSTVPPLNGLSMISEEQPNHISNQITENLTKSHEPLPIGSEDNHSFEPESDERSTTLSQKNKHLYSNLALQEEGDENDEYISKDVEKLESINNADAELSSTSRGVQEEDEEEEYDNSIQDIYGFYENRYSMHTSNGILGDSNVGSSTHNDFSDSTASLSTGIYSVESGVPEPLRNAEPRSWLDYQTDLGKVPEVNREAEASDSQTVDGKTPEISHLHIKKGHSRNSSIDPGFEASHVALGDNSEDRPYSQVVDSDIAELYQGSSEFLRRPISTYNPTPQRDFSDKSIKDLLTPHLEQDGFETPALEEKNEVPSLFVTSASPDPGLKKDNMVDVKEISATHSKPKNEASDNTSETKQKSFEGDHDYVDYPSFQASSSSGEDEDNEHDATSSDNGQFIDNEGHKNFGNELHGSQLTDSEKGSLSSTPRDSEPFILPSERNRLQQTSQGISTFDEPLNQQGSVNTKEITNSQHGHEHKCSEASGVSDAIENTSSSINTLSQDELRDVESTRTSEPSINNSSVTSAANQTSPQNLDSNYDPKSFESAAVSSSKPPQPIASKVKRPPQVDFSALLNNSGTSSEFRCQQMRILRAREAEYSSGLETWLMATLDQADNRMKIFVNGIPPAGDASNLEIPTTSKVSNVMHTSATNTKEKLGEVGKKSKNFFAKVIR